MPRRFGRYEVQREIGEGAMGRVYRCFDPLMKRIVAVKTVKKEFLTRETRDEYLRRFRREAQAAGRLSHPGIVSVYDVGDDFFVMEYLEGSTLQLILRERGRIAPDDAIAILTPLAEALDYAHRSGIVHRDIKPGNVFVCADGRPKIMDFGVAHLESSVATASGHFFGSPSYMAPEQVSGAEVTNSADLFSFAVLAYEVITGRRPFEGDSITAVMYRVVNEDPPPPRQWDFDLPASYDAIFKRALSKAPADRYPDAGALVGALQLKDIETELAALTDSTPPTPSVPHVPSTGSVPLPPLSPGEETADLRSHPGARPRRGWMGLLLLGLAVILALAGGATHWFRPPTAAIAPPPPVSVRPAYATFRVEAEPPGARVWVDDADVGPAPVLIPVPGGRHRVRVAIEGYAPAELSLDITAGTAPPPLRFVLEPVTVRLSVTSEPAGATVRVDGKSIGMAPLPAAVVPPGRHDVRVEKKGYASYAQRIDGAAGETVEINARLARLSAAPQPLPLPSPSPQWIPYEGALVAFDASVSPPKKISGSTPPYPDEARRVNLLGTVKVEMVVNERGEPTDIRVVESAGDILDRAVVNTLRTWRYEPAMKSGVKVKVRWSYQHNYVKQ
jgi:serine/threonine-protein kinase